MKQITYSRQARKYLTKLDRRSALIIREKVNLLAEDSARQDLDIKKLQNRPGYRLRVGSYRVIFSDDGLILLIEKIAPRGEVYKA